MTATGQEAVSERSSKSTPCHACGRATRTVFGRCPHCGHTKATAVVAGPARTTSGGDLLESTLTFALVVASACVVGGIAVVWLGFELLLAVLFAVALAALALALVSWW